MPLPDSAPRTYNAAQPFFSDDANQVVAWLVKTWEALGKEGFLFIDDFLGTALPPSSEQWAVTTTVGSQTQTRDDADAYGLLVLRPEAGERDRLQSHRFLFTGKTFRLAIRLRRYLALQAGDEVNVGLGGFAGGVIQLARRLLGRHGVKRDEDIPGVVCPHCGKPVDAHAEQAEGAEGPVGEKVARHESEP